jgi:hypothetical protein
MMRENSPSVGIENFGIFADGYNPFTNDPVVWTEFVTRLVTYPFLYLALAFFMVMYPIIDLFYILSF